MNQADLRRAAPRKRKSVSIEQSGDPGANKVAPFLSKLVNLVEVCPPEVGGWTPDGLSFLVNDEAAAQTVIPQFFSHTNFRSFCRQLSCCAFPRPCRLVWAPARGPGGAGRAAPGPSSSRAARGRSVGRSDALGTKI